MYDIDMQLQTEVDLETDGLDCHYCPHEVTVFLPAKSRKQISVLCSVTAANESFSDITADAAFNILKEREEAEAETGEKAAKAEYIEKKKKFNEELYDEITGYTMEHTEKHATDYCGFKVIIPANMLSNKLCVYLEHCGRYYVDIGDTDKGVMQRLYNASLESLSLISAVFSCNCESLSK